MHMLVLTSLFAWCSLASIGVSYLHHMELKPPVPLNRKENLAYYRIANHYKFIMQTFFDCLRVPRLIILEVQLQSLQPAGPFCDPEQETAVQETAATVCTKACQCAERYCSVSWL